MKLLGSITFYALISSLGLFTIKVADGAQDYALWFGALTYGAGFFIWLVILRKYPLSIAFPISAGNLIIATQAAGHKFLNETLPIAHLAGVMLMLSGMALVFSRA